MRNGALRAEASAQHPIALGVALSLCLPLSLALMLRVRDTARRIFFGACALVLVIGMVATISRTAFLALAVMLLVGPDDGAPAPDAPVAARRSSC